MRIKARPLGRAFSPPRRLAPPLRFGFDAPRQGVEPHVEIAGSGLKRALDAVFDHRQSFGRRLQRLGAFGAIFESRDRRFEQIVIAARIGILGAVARPARLKPRSMAGFVVEALVAPRQASDSFADGVEAVVASKVDRIDAAFGGAIGDHFVEPVAETQSRSAGRVFRKDARLAPHAPDLPGRRAVHDFARGRPSGNAAPPAHRGATPRLFRCRGEQMVKTDPKWGALGH